jgi:hypothetical protein
MIPAVSGMTEGGMKREPRWVKVFLNQLERSGNVRLAAEGAGVDFSTAYQRRKRHGEFAEAWEGALAAYRQGQEERDGEAEIAPPSPACAGATSPAKAGEEIIRPDGKLIRAGPGRWSRRAEGAFLAALAETANVTRAAEAAGVSTVAVYARRLKRPEFAEAWEAALDTGKARLEAMLVEAAQRRFDPDTLPIADTEPQVSVGEAIHIVKLKRSEPGQGPANGGGAAPRVASDAEVREALAKRLRAFGVRVSKAVEKGELGRCRKCGAQIEDDWWLPGYRQG